MASTSIPRAVPTPAPGTPAGPLALPVVDVGDASRRLLAIYPTAEVSKALDLDVPPRVRPLLALVHESLPPGRPLPDPTVVDELTGQLLAATAPGQELDPQAVGSDVPWCVAVGVILERDPALARKVAGVYAIHVDRLGLEEDLVAHPVVSSVVAYVTAATELALGRSVRASRWAREADAHVEAEPPGVSLAACVRAAALLGWGRSGALYVEIP